ncbi:MAG: TIGR00303 family protein [Snowella sp.]|nr:TIGR00303 family protein [Snowella sp.]
MITIYTQIPSGQQWLAQYRSRRPLFACLLGFTETGLIPGISAAGKTPKDRQYTAIADAEFLVNGCTPSPRYALPPLSVGVSPVFITRAVLETLDIPIYLFNSGLPIPPAVPIIDLEGQPAACLTTGNALPLSVVHHLFEQGLIWGKKLAQNCSDGYLIVSECVVGGTTTALALLTALGFDAFGKVNSSHPECNHQQKAKLVTQGLKSANLLTSDPFQCVATVGDPMQITAAGMAIAASQSVGVMLAGGTQMLAVHALIQAILKTGLYPANLNQIVVGTTRWVAEDRTGDTVGLAELIAPVSLIGTSLSFHDSRYPPLQVYEQGFVKEGVGAGASAIAATLYQNWQQHDLLTNIEYLLDRYIALKQTA